MSHDPLCSHTRLDHDDDCTKCSVRGCEWALLAATRADEREKAAQRVAEVFWPHGGPWMSANTTFDKLGRAARYAALYPVRGES